ncbi:sigma-70 family RNA polymerase sigma factor [Candidatus Uhrbacteria bacterium]|nr:sigma-70 family RNA polymerase sigma factor [Candidatus Uhrbacteria bacterium]
MGITHEQLRDPACFESVVVEFLPKLYRYAAAHLRSREDAEEVVSAVFTRLWEYVHAREKGIIEHLPAFLYRSARHALIDLVRKRRPEKSLDELAAIGQEPRVTSPGREHERIADHFFLETALLRLRPDDRDLLIWRFIEGLPVNEIADLKHLSENAVSVRIYRALARLRKIMEKLQ